MQNPVARASGAAWRTAMLGVITTQDVIKNAGLIAREFGLKCLVRCAVVVLQRKPTTFLEIAVRPTRE